MDDNPYRSPKPEPEAPPRKPPAAPSPFLENFVVGVILAALAMLLLPAVGAARYSKPDPNSLEQALATLSHSDGWYGLVALVSLGAGGTLGLLWKSAAVLHAWQKTG